MSIIEILILAVGLSMDAFAVAVCKGLSLGRANWRRAGLVGIWFGSFQALMPLVGFFLGSSFRRYVEAVDHWIAFGLLLLIGLNMIREAFSAEKEEGRDLSPRAMLPLAVATSIDALAVGVSFAMSEVRVIPAVLLIGAVTFAISAAGVFLGHICGSGHRKAAQIVGGCILILIGTKILLEDIGIISF